MRSHIKVDLQGNVPFSWEDMPGVSKYFIPQNCPSDHQPQITPLPCSHSKSTSDDAKRVCDHDHSLPPPPPVNSYGPRRPHRSFSKRILLREEHEEETDPFLAALVECTKSVTAEDQSCDNYKKSFIRFGLAGSSSKGAARKISRSFSLFSCKLRPSHDVVENNVVKVSSRSRSYST